MCVSRSGNSYPQLWLNMEKGQALGLVLEGAQFGKVEWTSFEYPVMPLQCFYGNVSASKLGVSPKNIYLYRIEGHFYL